MLRMVEGEEIGSVAPLREACHSSLARHSALAGCVEAAALRYNPDDWLISQEFFFLLLSWQLTSTITKPTSHLSHFHALFLLCLLFPLGT